MKKYLICLAAFILSTQCHIFAQQAPRRFEKDIQAFEQLDDSIDYPDDAILFVGSSSIRMWKSLEEDMAPLPVINRGFGGSTIPDVNYYADRIILPHDPEMIVFYCGENDLANDASKAKDAVKSFKVFYDYMEENLPKTEVFFLAIKPSISREHYWSKMKKANTKIKKFIERKPGFYYVDVATPMSDENGKVLQNIFIQDNLHMNAKGYAIWTSTLKPILEKYYDN